MPRNDFLSRVGDRLDELVARSAASGRRSSPAAEAGLIVMLSGGPDSVALLLACRDWGRRRGRPVAAAHLNHLLRGDSADEDAGFCRALCRRLDIPCFEKGADPRPVARLRGRGLEEAGRQLRRAFGEDLLRAHPTYAWLATGHHRDDQLETVLMRLFRGTGPAGLSGIRPVSGVWLHPMLAVARAEIIAFLEAQGQPWRIDASNRDGDNQRARLRRELLPLLQGIFGPGCLAGPVRLAGLWDEDLALLESLTERWYDQCLGPDGSLLVPALVAHEPAAVRRILHRWLAAAGVENLARVHVENTRRWLAEGVSGSTVALPGGWVVGRDFDRLECRRTGNAGPARRDAGDFRIVVASAPAPDDATAQGLREGAGDAGNEATWRLTCPADALSGNLQVRAPRPGDRFQPFGLNGTKKLSDVLREHRVTRNDRKDVLVVADDRDILWVVGLARSERTRLLPYGAQTITISVVRRTESDQTRDNNR